MTKIAVSDLINNNHNQRGHFKIPPVVQNATSNYKSIIDVPGRYVYEMCVKSPDFSEQSSMLYNAYREWCEKNGHKPLSITAIAEDWKRLGFEKYSSKGKNRWRGVQLK